mgnify:CR=1 FL=1
MQQRSLAAAESVGVISHRHIGVVEKQSTIRRKAPSDRRLAGAAAATDPPNTSERPIDTHPNDRIAHDSPASRAAHRGTYGSDHPLETDDPDGLENGGRSERQVEPKCFVEFGTQSAVEGADQRSDALGIDRSNLLRLSFRVARKPG